MNSRHTAGFTLIELSIVLVIIGLMVGAVIGGKALVHQAEIQSVIRDVASIKTAINAFQMQYDYLPGDFPDASSYWSGMGGGNGDGKIEPTGDGLMVGIGAWTHLGLAEIFPGRFQGVSPTDAGNFAIVLPGENTYGSKIKGGAYVFGWSSIWGWQRPGYNYFGLKRYAGDNLYEGKGIMIARDAINIDKKIDDGLASSGKMLGTSDGVAFHPSNGCATENAGNFGEPAYLPQDTSANCNLYFFFEE